MGNRQCPDLCSPGLQRQVGKLAIDVFPPGLNVPGCLTGNWPRHGRRSRRPPWFGNWNRIMARGSYRSSRRKGEQTSGTAHDCARQERRRSDRTRQPALHLTPSPYEGGMVPTILFASTRSPCVWSLSAATMAVAIPSVDIKAVGGRLTGGPWLEYDGVPSELCNFSSGYPRRSSVGPETSR